MSVQVPDILTSKVSLYCALDLSFNLLSSLPPSLPLHLPHLVSLNLSHNHLSSLPDSIFAFLHLKDLDVSHNLLPCLPPSICLLDRLRKLDLSHNILMKLPPDLDKLQSLERLNLSENPLQVDCLTTRGVAQAPASRKYQFIVLLCLKKTFKLGGNNINENSID